MRRRRSFNKKSIPLVLLILCLNIGFALLSTNLGINGLAHVKNPFFNVYFDNVQVVEGSAKTVASPKITDKTSLSFESDFYDVADFYEFTFDVVNAGTIDAMIGDVTNTVLTEEQKNVFDYTIKYTIGSKIKKYDLISAGETLTIKVRLSVKAGVTNDVLQNVTFDKITFFESIDYVKADENAKTVEPPPPPTMLNIGYGYNDSKLSELKSYYPNLATVILNDSINVPEGAPNWDISEEGNGAFIAYVVPNSTNNAKYDLHIEGEGGINAPIDSKNLFQLTSKQWDYSVYTHIEGLNLLNTSQVTNMNSMFYYCRSLTGLDLSSLNTSKVTNMGNMFNGCSGLTSLDLSSFDTRNVTNMLQIFCNCSNLSTLDLSVFDTSQVTDMYGMFSSCSNLINLDLSPLDTSQVTDMTQMFCGCGSLTSLDLSSFDTSNVINMRSMFWECNCLVSIDFRNVDTSQVTDMYRMFFRCSSLTSLDLSNFDTSQVTSISGMFENCSGLTNLDLSNFDTSSVTTMSSMFRGCSSLTSLNISSLDTRKVTYMDYMFYCCSSLTSLDLGSFDTSKVTDMDSMFSSCSSLTSLDLSSFDTSQVTDIQSMFGGCRHLTSLDFRKASFGKVIGDSGMFSSVSSGIEIIVKDDTAKTWILSRTTNAVVKTVAEL